MRSAYFPNGVEADMYMRLRYESTFGIYDHFGPDNPNVPWPLMAVCPTEDMNSPDFLRLRLDQHAELKVFDIHGISFDVFMEYPRRELLQILANTRKQNEKLAANGFGARMTNLEKMLNNMGNGKTPQTPAAKTQK